MYENFGNNDILLSGGGETFLVFPLVPKNYDDRHIITLRFYYFQRSPPIVVKGDFAEFYIYSVFEGAERRQIEFSRSFDDSLVIFS